MTINNYLILITLIIIALSTIGYIFPLNIININKASPYECGFDPLNSSRLPFSFRFFLIAILFLIFDLEIALLIPLPFSLNFTYYQNSIFFLALFIIILSIGLYYEWISGGLEWANN
uniref:NADH-ubiquinone oxidoreductase chain 3 n=1 Tax=Ophiophthalmus serratus TaxID=2993811 RepID=A0A9E8D061_9ECHI|nr:NADH dehydrogenase subunit 3 [Ophiophthalmus serratus]UZG65885.1 NADH dehydrogenase subunit 3 [Ophiophthalmus serratus]